MKRFLLGVLLALLAGFLPGSSAGGSPGRDRAPSGEELTAAMAAYAEITKDPMTFTLEEEDATGISLSITPEAARNVAGRENLFSIGYQGSRPRRRPGETSGATSKAEDGSLP